jgi:hypothetical protein
MARYKKGEWSGTKQKILMLHVEGKTQTEIAKELGKNSSTICEHIHRPEFEKRVAKLQEGIQEKVKNKFAGKGMRAAEKIVQIMESGSPEDRIRLDAAKEILYQIGCKPVEVVETRTRDYTPQEIQSAMLVMKEVETITERLGTRKSPFILEKKIEGEVTSPPAPCNSDVNTSSPEENSGESSSTPSNA